MTLFSYLECDRIAFGVLSKSIAPAKMMSFSTDTSFILSPFFAHESQAWTPKTTKAEIRHKKAPDL